MDSWKLLLEIVLLLGACLILGTICTWLKQSPIVGYLMAGMILGGPGSLGVLQEEKDIEAIAELGVALLLFSLGLEFSWRRLMGLGSKTLLSGAIQVIATAMLGAVVALLFRVGVKEAVAVGAMLSLSSTAVVLRVLIDRGDIDSLHARNSLAILLVQDMAVVPLALLMTLLSEGGTPSEVALSLAKLLALALGLVAVLYVLLNQVAVRVLHAMPVGQNRELTVLLAIVVGLGASWAAHAVKLSPALGAFIAGMFLGSSPFAVQLRADVSSLRTVLLTLFFGAVGIVADPVWLVTHLPFVLSVAALIIVLKAAVVWKILRRIGQSHSVALATGLCLSQVGEFAFVLGTAGRDGGVVSKEVHMTVVSATIATLFLTPYLVALAPSAGNWLERRRKTPAQPAAQPDSEQLHPDVLIIGFGPAGQAIGRALVGKKHTVIVLDVNPQGKLLAESLGLIGQIGDGTQFEVLEHAHVRSAKLVVITLPSRSAALTVLQTVRQLAPQAHIVVRSRYQLHLAEFEQAGADAVIGDEEQVGYRLSAYVNLRLAMLDS
jgi:CPA2 family monovalent cation:H+ antiporter-2